LAYLALVEQTVAPPRAIVAGIPKLVLCAADGCKRPVAVGSEYCCPSCEHIAAFEDPELKCANDDHDADCKLRFFDHQQEHGTPANVGEDQQSFRAGRPKRLTSI